MDAGIRFVYCGNVHHPPSDTTWCPGCGEAVIVRDWYDIQAWDLHGGACGGCGAAIPGVFEDQPGTWGRRQKRVTP
jgi:pyruvate formate lyase activating enzyme